MLQPFSSCPRSAIELSSALKGEKEPGPFSARFLSEDVPIRSCGLEISGDPAQQLLDPLGGVEDQAERNGVSTTIRRRCG